MNEVTIFNEIKTIANGIAGSRLLPAKYRKRPEDLIAIGLLGKGLGLDIWQSIRTLHVIEGVPTMSAELMMGLAMLRCPKAQFKYETGPDFCRLYARRDKDQDFSVFEYTLDDAKRAGLLGKKNWRENPKSMLKSRVQSYVAKTLFPDCIMGLYTPEEINNDVVLDDTGEVILDAKAEIVEHDGQETKFSLVKGALTKYIGEAEADAYVTDLRSTVGDEDAMKLILTDLNVQVKQTKITGDEDAIGDTIRGWFAGRRRTEEERATAKDDPGDSE